MRGLIHASRGTIGAAMLLGAVSLDAVKALEPENGEAAAILGAQVAKALAARGTDYKLWIPPHTATCLVEIGGQARTLTATLAPKLLVRDGRAEKIWVNLAALEGPTAVKATLWTAARLADNVGLFQLPLIKSVNRFISTTCPKKYPLAAPSPVKRK